MKSKLFRFNSIILSIFIIFFVYQNIIMISLMQKNDLKEVYLNHHELIYPRLILNELEVSTYTHFTVNSIFKIIFNFIQSVGVIEILFILFSISIYLNKEKDNRLVKYYVSFYYIFFTKILIAIILFLLAYLTYTISVSIAWLILMIIFGLSIIYYLFVLFKLIKIEFF